MSLRWQLPELKAYVDEGFHIDEKVTLPEVTDRDKEIRHLSEVHVTGFCDVKKDVISFFLTLTGEMVLPCALTLKDVPWPFKLNTSETFKLNSRVEVDESLDETVHEVEEHVVDLSPYLTEAILVAKPLKVVSEEAKAGDYKPEGNGWELVTEEEQKQKVDPRLAKLKDLFNESDKEQ